jgi:hypothetical protein
LKQRPSHNTAYIHSKPVVYINNGSGRDSYISSNSGGLRAECRPAHGQRTFYSNLRKYDQTAQPNRGASHMATSGDKRDLLSNTQNKFSDKFRRNNTLVKNYQNMLDARLSLPKSMAPEEDDTGKVFRNSVQKIQRQHQDRVYRTSASFGHHLLDDQEQDAYSPMDSNIASYNRLKKPRNTIDM